MTTWQFVADMASDTPAVSLDLNVAPINVTRYDLSPSDFAKAYSGSSLYDIQQPTFNAARNRVLHIELTVSSPNATGFAQAAENLGRQLGQDNILKYQPTNTIRPVFFRTFANPAYAAQVRGIVSTCTAQYQNIALDIEAEFPAYGPREEAVNSPFTVSNDPAAGSNGCFFDVTSVKGDMPTPLLIHATSTGVTGTPSGLASRWSHFGMRRRGTPGNYVNFVQAEAMTQGLNTATVADATASGGSKSRITFGTATMNLRLNGTFPGNGVANVEARGEYAVYLRCQNTAATSTINVSFRYGASDVGSVTLDSVSASGSTTWSWLYLGKMPCPPWADPVEHGFSGVRSKVLMPWFGVYVERTFGAANFDMDAFYFVPADDLTTIAKFASTSTTYAVDGTTDAGGAVYAMTAALDEIVTTNVASTVIGGGGFPEAIPGQTNRVHFLRDVSPTGNDTIGSTTTFRVYYWPRWRELTRTQ